MIKEFLYHHLELDTWNSRRQFGLFKSSWRKNEALINVFVFARVKIHSGFLFFPLLIKIVENFLPDQNVYTES